MESSERPPLSRANLCTQPQDRTSVRLQALSRVNLCTQSQNRTSVRLRTLSRVNLCTQSQDRTSVRLRTLSSGIIHCHCSITNNNRYNFHFEINSIKFNCLQEHIDFAPSTNIRYIS